MKTVLLLLAALPLLAATCEELGGKSVPTGDFQTFKALPAFCRVELTLKPSADSDVKVEVWLPAAGWNGKFEAVGNGGWAGSINYADLVKALKAGYATSSTDTGHSGANGQFALGHPEKLIDFAWRSEHEMTVKAKALIAAFYGSAPKRSYWVGCSSGGKQGLKEAQRFPEDYDGVVAGAPIVNWVRRAVEDVWVAHAALKDPASNIPPSKYPLLHKAALDACDQADGLKDGLIGDPARCRFDPAVLQCKDADGPACLTGPQVEAARKIYTAPKNPRTGEVLSARFEPGSELGWRNIAGGPEPFSIASDYFKYVVYKDPQWDWRTFDFDAGVTKADATDDGLINANSKDLAAFAQRGGKIILYQGWTDTNITPASVIAYFDDLKRPEWARLYMAPGMNHCGGGEGPNVFDMPAALEKWVEQGQAPGAILASHLAEGKTDRTRPLCPYPQVAQYKGSGSIDEAASFACALP